MSPNASEIRSHLNDCGSTPCFLEENRHLDECGTTFCEKMTGAFQNQEKSEKEITDFFGKDQKKQGGFKNKTLIKTPTSPKKTEFFSKDQKKKRSVSKRLIFFF